MIKKSLLMLFGLIALPFLLLVERVIQKRPAVPAIFWELISHFDKRGIRGYLKMQKIEVNGVDHLASLAISQKADNFKVLTLALCPWAPQYSHQARNGRVVLACTFLPSDDVLAKRHEMRSCNLFPVPNSLIAAAALAVLAGCLHHTP